MRMLDDCVLHIQLQVRPAQSRVLSADNKRGHAEAVEIQRSGILDLASRALVVVIVCLRALASPGASPTGRPPPSVPLPSKSPPAHRYSWMPLSLIAGSDVSRARWHPKYSSMACA